MRSGYRTKHRADIAEYMRTVPGVHLTVRDICEHFAAEGSPIGQTTVYRQIERMVAEGLVAKYVIDANTPACFAYIAESSRRSLDASFHCKCEKCGKLIHLRCEELEGIGEHLAEAHGFDLDPLRTVFYGLCEQCRIS